MSGSVERVYTAAYLAAACAAVGAGALALAVRAVEAAGGPGAQELADSIRAMPLPRGLEELDAMLAEAEARGYARGIAEAAAPQEEGGEEA